VAEMKRSAQVRTGLGWGLAFATCYSGYVLLLWIARGRVVFDRVGMNVWEVILAYYGSGLVGGAIVGALLPLGRSRPGAALLGFLVAFPVLYTLGMFLEPAAAWGSELLLAAALSASFVGPLCGLAVWHIDRRFRHW